MIYFNKFFIYHHFIFLLTLINIGTDNQLDISELTIYIIK